MNIKRKSQFGGAIIVTTIVITVIVAAFGVNRIRFGGELHRQNQQISDFVADILPPPSYVLEPYLEATQLVANPDTLSTHRERLKKLEADYRTEQKRWAQSDIDSDLKQRMASQSDVTASQFWSELDTVLIPAASQRNQAEMQASYRRLSDIYTAHRAQIDALVFPQFDWLDFHRAIHPPSTGNVAPVMYLDCSPQRKTTAAAISSVVPNRPTRTRPRVSSAAALLSVSGLSISVSTYPGATQLTVTPKGAHSLLRHLVSWIKPALATEYPMMPRVP